VSCYDVIVLQRQRQVTHRPTRAQHTIAAGTGARRRDGLHTGVGARDGRARVGDRPEHVGEDEGQVRRGVADRQRGPARLARLPRRPRHHRRPQRHHVQLRHVRRQAAGGIPRHDDGRAE